MSPYRDCLSTLSFALALLNADLMIFYHTTLLWHEDRLTSDFALGLSNLPGPLTASTTSIGWLVLAKQPGWPVNWWGDYQ